MYIYVSACVAVIGAVVYLVASTPVGGKISEMGKLSFFAGLFVFLMQVGAIK